MHSNLFSASVDATIPHILPEYRESNVDESLSGYGSRPLAVLDIHSDHTLTLISPSDHRYQLQKSYVFHATAHSPHGAGVWEGSVGGADTGHWKAGDEPYISRHLARDVCLDDLRDLADLINLIGKSPHVSIALGKLKNDRRVSFHDGAWHVPSREKHHYDDVPSVWLPIDVDALSCEPQDAPDHIDDFISEVLPDFEGCAYVWHHSGSSGIKGTRIRLWFQLDEPRTLAEKRAFIGAIVKRSGKGIIDDAIYQESRLLLTAPPHLTARVWDGDHVKFVPVRRPVPTHATYVAGDLAHIPAGVAPTAAQYEPFRESLTKSAAADLLTQLGPGNYNAAINRWLCHVAWVTAAARAEQAFREAVTTIRDRIRETSEPGRLVERLEKTHGNPRILRAKWDAARERRKAAAESKPVVGTNREQPPTSLTGMLAAAAAANAAVATAPRTIGEARAQFRADLDNAIRDGLANKGRHFLFAHPMGMGKTVGLVGALSASAGIITSNVMRYTVPSYRLAEQFAAALIEALKPLEEAGRLHGYMASKLVRIHKGRNQPGMCPDSASRLKAERAERLGVSPKKKVCPNCATGKAGLCPWLKQDDNDQEPGVIVEVHALSVATRESRRSDLTIIDESVLGTILRSAEDLIDVASLAHVGAIRKKANALGSVGPKLFGPTNELAGYRDALATALRLTLKGTPKGKPQRVHVNMLTDLTQLVTFKAKVGRRYVEQTGTQLDAALALESRLQESLIEQIDSAEGAGKAVTSLMAQLKASREAAKVYEAIKASIGAGREYVFAVAAHWETVNGRRVERLLVTTRSAEVASLFGSSSIMLDGTADEGIWRALVSPTGAPFVGGVLTAAPPIQTDAVHAFRYADMAGARSQFIARADLTASELENVERLDQLKALPVGLRNAVFDGGLYEAEVAVAQVNVDSDALNRRERKQRADSSLGLLWRFILERAAHHSPRAVPVTDDKGNTRPVAVLIVVQKEVRALLAKMGLPNNVALEHFGALRGLNHYERVPCAVIVGRPRPSNIVAECLTEALYMHDARVTEIERYDVDPKVGRPWREDHPTPRVNAVLGQISGAEVAQAAARLRLYDRSAATACELHVFGQWAAGPVEPLMERTLWSDADRHPIEVAAGYGMVFSDNRLNQVAYGALFPKGSDMGNGRVDKEARRQFAQLLCDLAVDVKRTTVRDELTSNVVSIANKKVGGEGLEIPISDRDPIRGKIPPTPISGRGRPRKPIPVAAIENALAKRADDQATPYWRHKAVKFRTPASRKATYAIVAESVTATDVAARLGAPVESWRELSLAELLAMTAD